MGNLNAPMEKGMKDKKQKQYARPLNTKPKQYTYDVAMRVAAKRAESHPVPISMTSNIRTWIERDG